MTNDNDLMHINHAVESMVLDLSMSDQATLVRLFQQYGKLAMEQESYLLGRWYRQLSSVFFDLAQAKAILEQLKAGADDAETA